MNLSRKILLTGAGFSKNFGGFLATEMWAKIFNYPNLENALKVKGLLRTKFDFEDAYWEVMTGSEYSEDDRKIFTDAVWSAYKDMDDMLKGYMHTGSDPYQIDFHKIRDFLTLFTGGAGELGLHFTLNQDLFLERQLNRVPAGFIGLKYKDYREQIQTKKIDPDRGLSMPDDAYMEDFEKNHFNSSGNLVYIKLHGSFGWVSSNGDQRMVLGRNKEKEINSEPILKWYYRLFNDSVIRPDTKILIVGYGFRDSHINSILEKGINAGAKLYVIAPGLPEVAKENIHQSLWNGVDGYFPYSLQEIFPEGAHSNTHVYNELLRIFK